MSVNRIVKNETLSCAVWTIYRLIALPGTWHTIGMRIYSRHGTMEGFGAYSYMCLEHNARLNEQDLFPLVYRDSKTIEYRNNPLFERAVLCYIGNLN